MKTAELPISGDMRLSSEHYQAFLQSMSVEQLEWLLGGDWDE